MRTDMATSLVRARGFTLIELLIVLCIAAVLGMMAVPSYRAYLERSHRLDAVVALLQVQQAQERWRAGHESFAPNLSTLGLSPDAAGSRYRLAIDRIAADGYVVVATALAAPTPSAACLSLSLVQQAGETQYDSTGTAAARHCWNR